MEQLQCLIIFPCHSFTVEHCLQYHTDNGLYNQMTQLTLRHRLSNCHHHHFPLEDSKAQTLTQPPLVPMFHWTSTQFHQCYHSHLAFLSYQDYESFKCFYVVHIDYMLTINQALFYKPECINRKAVLQSHQAFLHAHM